MSEDIFGVDPVHAGLERALRAVLAERDPGPAGDDLRRRVDRVPEEIPPDRRSGAIARVAPYVAVAAALVVLIAGLGALRSLGGGIGGPGTEAMASSFDPYATGIGVVEPPSQPWVVLVVAALAYVAFLGAGVLNGRKSGVLAVLAFALPAAFLATQFLPPPVQTGGGYGEDNGITNGEQFGYQYGDVTGGVVTVKAGEPYSFIVRVTNVSLVPLRFDGIIAAPPLAPGAPELPSLWLISDPRTWDAPDVAFTPQWLAPGASINLWVVQRASTCITAPNEGGGSSSLGAIPIRWSVLGIVPREDVLELPYLIDTPVRIPCPAGVTGG